MSHEHTPGFRLVVGLVRFPVLCAAPHTAFSSPSSSSPEISRSTSLKIPQQTHRRQSSLQLHQNERAGSLFQPRRPITALFLQPTSKQSNRTSPRCRKSEFHPTGIEFGTRRGRAGEWTRERGFFFRGGKKRLRTTRGGGRRRFSSRPALWSFL